MNIKFEQKNEQLIWILDADANTGQPIGHIFTPSGTMKDTPSAIQVCGFDRAFDLWGCGLFGNSDGIMKQDIQLLFNKDSRLHKSFNIEDAKCYCPKSLCQCDKLRLFNKKELIVEAIEKD
jgi:hypothetical protein